MDDVLTSCGFSITSILFAIIIILTVYYLWPVVNPSLAHIPGAWPLPIIGNMLPYIKHGTAEADKMNTKKYGKVFRIYEGRQPTVVVNDEVLAKLVTIKEFSNFSNRRIIPFRGVLKHALTDLRGDNWRRSRVMLTPSFTTGKLKKMIPSIQKCAERLAEIIETGIEKGDDLDYKRCCGMYTMDVIASTGFSVELDQKDHNNPFIKNGLALLDFSTASFPFLIAFFLPFLIKPFELLGVELFPKKPMHFFIDMMKNIIKDRQSSTSHGDMNDLLQPMLNAHKEVHDHETKEDLQKLGLTNAKNTTKEFSMEDILGNSLIFFLAGYETTSNTLSWLLYELSQNEEIQEKVLEEINSVMANYKEVNYEAVSKMQYLDQCLQETMRKYPAITRVDRYTEQDITIEGIRIPADTLVIIPIYLLHYNPDVWPEPDAFKPERFDREARKESTAFHMPFGQGPRHCIAMRLALMEMKLAVVKLIPLYKFTASKKETKVKFDFNAKAVDGVWVSTEKRQVST